MVPPVPFGARIRHAEAGVRAMATSWGPVLT